MIHTSYTVGITTAEFKALESVTTNQQEWIENAIQNRARIAIENIQTNYTNFKINKGEAITAVGTTAVIEAAYSEGVIGIAPELSKKYYAIYRSRFKSRKLSQTG